MPMVGGYVLQKLVQLTIQGYENLDDFLDIIEIINNVDKEITCRKCILKLMLGLCLEEKGEKIEQWSMDLS
jgi:hypothetical protein